LQVIKITKRLHKNNKAKVYSPRLPSVFLAQLNKSEFAAFQEKYENLQVLLSKRSLLYEVDFGANVLGLSPS
jgi:penicillin-binding protein 2